MIVKMLITFNFDPETNEYTPLKQEIVKDKVKKVTKAEEAVESADAQLTLESNKYILNKAAAALMGVTWEDRLDIKYQPIEKGHILFPIIGTDAAWKTKSGNKLTKNLTVVCRGNANELLSKYGDTFTITPWKDHEGLFVLIGNKDRSEEPTVIDNNIKIKEDDNPIEDLSLDPELDDSYKIDSLEFEI